MTTKVRKADAQSARAKRLRTKLVGRSAEDGKFISLSQRKLALKSKLERLRRQSRDSTVEVLAES